jgi:hypothetical protein
MGAARLSAAEREFLDALGRVVYGNPFSDERKELIGRLLARAGVDPAEPPREALASVVEPRLRPYRDAAVLAALEGRDRRLVDTAFLYVCYQRHVPALDALIERQAAGEEDGAAGEVAGAVIAELARCGFGEPAATRYFAIFFQLRRAFRFIVPSLAGECESMRRLRRALWDNVFTHDMDGYDRALWSRMEDFSTLLLGETGTGKGSAAAAIGRSVFIPYLPRERRFAANFMHSFIAINLSQFPETLIESELFGHRKGAFTGAIEHHVGVFERCSAHGALFLDEIGEVSIPVQIKLLQVLQERTFTPLGSREARRFAGRVIAATNRPLDKLRRAGRFRHDFYYRLCSDVIQVPTLRQRIEESPAELPLLVGLLVERICGTRDMELAGRVMESLERDLPRGYRWPGNVRELEQAVRRVLLTGRYGGDLAASVEDGEETLAEAVRTGSLSAKELLGRYCALLYRRSGSYAEVAERTGLDRRTARKYATEGAAAQPLRGA